jgi:hypothetical protein
VQRRGAPESEIRFFDVERRADLAVRLPRARYAGAELDADRRGVWFIRTEDGGPRLYHHSLATPATGANSLVFGEQLGPDAALGIRGFSERTLARHRPLPRRHAQFPMLDMARVDEGIEYSPYHTLDTANASPPLLMVAAASSPVPPFHARKMIARLQTATASAGHYLLREETLPAGTIGPRFAPVENLADLLAFVLTITARDTSDGPRS